MAGSENIVPPKMIHPEATQKFLGSFNFGILQTKLIYAGRLRVRLRTPRRPVGVDFWCLEKSWLEKDRL